MAVTTRLGLQLLEQGQSGSEIVLNTDLNLLDAGTALLGAAQTFTNTNTFTGAVKIGGVLGGTGGVPISRNAATITFPSNSDYTLTATEAEAEQFTINTTNIASPLNMIVPNRASTFFLVTNNSGFSITVKTSGGTGIAIASFRRALLTQGASFNVTRVSSDITVTP